MKQILSDTDRRLLDKLIAEAEGQTRAQIVLATVSRSDNYAEIPWKAFAFGASITAFAVFLMDLLLFRWTTDTMILFSVAAILAVGAIFVLLTLMFSGFARLFLSESRREAETLQYAESLFLSRELFTTEGRRGILLLVSQFERQVIILPDKGVRDRLNAGVMRNIISKMKKDLRQDEVKKALETGLKELVSELCPSASSRPDKNELSDEIITGEGV
ncbi:MAG: TPM domain-containing protein [Bacteroidales bacterium]|nr:TPM domain-containing protein [Bacteroidales bacterium]MBK8882747.1 TPM domain-containing protein [Bacteroidales bacterium]